VDDVDPPHRLSLRGAEVAGVERPGRQDVREPAPDVEVPEPLSSLGTPPLALCIAGRGPLDELPCAMLAQLLGKHGFAVRTVSHDAASRGRIASLDTENVSLVCVVSLAVIGGPPHLRYLVRRLRQRLPDRPILLGLREGLDGESQTEQARLLGADACAASLREMVIAAVEQVTVPEIVPAALPSVAAAEGV
jgi:hypothetical protein